MSFRTEPESLTITCPSFLIVAGAGDRRKRRTVRFFMSKIGEQ